MVVSSKRTLTILRLREYECEKNKRVKILHHVCLLTKPSRFCKHLDLLTIFCPIGFCVYVTWLSRFYTKFSNFIGCCGDEQSVQSWHSGGLD
jgi:hypothetical protein